MSLPPSFLLPGHPWHLVASTQILGGETGGGLKEGKERQGLGPSPDGLDHVLWRGPEQRNHGGWHGGYIFHLPRPGSWLLRSRKEGTVLHYLALHSKELRYSNLFLEISSIPFCCLRVR